MKKQNEDSDSALQELVANITAADADSLPVDKADVKAYLQLFALLNEKPISKLPDGFSDGVVANLRARRDRIADFRWNFLLPIFTFVLLGILYLGLLYGGQQRADKVLSLFIRFKWHVGFAFLLFFAVQFFDYRFWTRSPARSCHYS